MRRVLSVLLLTCALSFPAFAHAQFGLLKQGIDAVAGGKTAAPGAPPAAAAGSAAGVLARDTTYTNAARQFEFTIPAGWKLENGDPAGESVLFMKPGTSWSFQFHIEQMVPSFPRKASVDASLKQAREMVQIKKYQEARRRDDGSAKGKCGVIGWEIVEAPQKNDYERIIWQAYDGQNFYMNFMAASENGQFEAARATLRRIMDSIRFCR